MNKRTLQVVAVTVLCACAVLLMRPIAASAADDPKAAAELKALDAEWAKAAGAKNVDKTVSYYADDAVAYPPGVPAVRGRENFKKAWGEMLGTPGLQSFGWKTTSAGADGNLGYTSGTYQETVKSKDGKTTTETGKYVCVWRKGADGKWKAIHDIWNADK